MKKKAFRKRLVLSKTTVVNLDASQMGGIELGGSLGKATCDCPTAVYNCTTQDPMRICLNTCDCVPTTDPDTSVAVPCIVTDCC